MPDWAAKWTVKNPNVNHQPMHMRTTTIERNCNKNKSLAKKYSNAFAFSMYFSQWEASDWFRVSVFWGACSNAILFISLSLILVISLSLCLSLSLSQFRGLVCTCKLWLRHWHFKCTQIKLIKRNVRAQREKERERKTIDRIKWNPSAKCEIKALPRRIKCAFFTLAGNRMFNP